MPKQNRRRNGQKVVHVENHYHYAGGPDSHMIRTEKEKKQVEQGTGVRQEETAIVDYEKASFADFSKKANALFEDIGEEVEAPASMQTIFTNAYNTESVAVAAARWYAMNHAKLPDNIFKIDMLSFIAYCHSTVQLILTANDDIVGVHGFTRDIVNDAKAVLREWYVPDFIVTCIAGFRPIQLLDTDTKVVLLPYRYIDAGGNVINHDVVFNPAAPGIPAGYDIFLQDPVFYERPFGGQVVQIAVPARNLACFRRTCFFVNYINTAAARQLVPGPNNLPALTVNAMIGHAVVAGEYPYYDVLANVFRRNIHGVRSIYEILLPVSAKLLASQQVIKLANNLQAEVFHKARIKDRLPLQISNIIGAGDNILWMEHDYKEKFTPWFVTRTYNRAILISRTLRRAVGLDVPVVRVPREEWLGDVRYVAYADTVTDLMCGKPRAFKNIRSQYGF